MIAMEICRDGYFLGLVFTLLASCTQLIKGAPAYTARPYHEPPCPHTVHATLCWTVQLKAPLHFQLSPASAENPFSQDTADSAVLYGHPASFPFSSLKTSSVHMLTNQSSLVKKTGELSSGMKDSAFDLSVPDETEDSSSRNEVSWFHHSSELSAMTSSGTQSQSGAGATKQEEKHFSSKSSSLKFQPEERLNEEASTNKKTSVDTSQYSSQPQVADVYAEVPRHQKEYVYHQIAVLVAKEVGLSLLGKVGELYDHFVLCYEEASKENMSQQSSSGPATQGGKAFQLYHKAHDDLKKSDIATFEQIKDQAEVALHEHQDVAWFTMETVHHRQKRSIEFNDPAFPHQWHLVNRVEIGMDINVTGVWERGVTGKGVTVAVVDDGLEWNNPDLHDNYNFMGSWDLNDNDPDPMPNGAKVSNHHGTRCAGEIAAVANNKVCGVGVAYGAKVSGIRVLDGPMTDSLEAEAFNKKFDINAVYSCSWGPDDDGKTVDGPHILAAKAMKYGIEFGRHGYGSIFVVASGNGGSKQDNCNYDGYANSIYTVTIGAVDESGAMPFYAEECASMLGVTFSSGIASRRDIVTTDWRQKGSTGCTDRHTGTSASAPLAAGMIALMLEAQPCLTWRDVQYLIIITSVKIDRDLAHWQKNGAGLEHSHKHGFGLISAWRMVNAARVWRSVSWMTSYSEEETDGWNIPHGSSNPLIVSHTVTPKDIAGYSLYMLEYVQVTVTLTHPFRGKLGIHLYCPSGTDSVIGAPRPQDNSTDGFKDWTFTTVRCWGELPTGTWIMKINDTLPADSVLPTGYLSKWRLTLFGTPMTTDEFQKRRMEVERAMTGHHLSTNFTPPCDPPPVTTPPYIPFSEKTLKILFLASIFCVIFAMYETMEYMLCYGEEKRQQAEEEQRARSRQRRNCNGLTPETTGLLTGNNEQETDWLRHTQSAFREEEDDDDMFLMDAGIASQLSRARGMGARNDASEGIPLSAFKTRPGQRSGDDITGRLSETSPSSGADGWLHAGASPVTPNLPGVDNHASRLQGHAQKSAIEIHSDGKLVEQTSAKNSILPEIWRALTHDQGSDSDSQDELFNREAESSVSLLHNNARKSYR